MPKTITPIKHEDWTAEAKRRFGDDPMGWRFKCPNCGHVASVKDWKDAGAPEGSVAFSCVGRWTGGEGTIFQNPAVQPCNYTNGGLFNIAPVGVLWEDTSGKEIVRYVFDFAD